MRRLASTDFPRVRALLQQCDLLVDDLEESNLRLFLGIEADGVLVSVGGIQVFGTEGLLRSLVTAPSCRGRGYASQLVDGLERLALEQGATSLYLLTETAEEFFHARGYQPANRAAAPLTISTTPQFTSLCPSSSRLMVKRVAA